MLFAENWAIILAAGSGSRMGDQPTPKQFIIHNKRPLYFHSALAFSRAGCVDNIIFVFPKAHIESERQRLASIGAEIGLNWQITAGGPRRRDSVANGLALIPLKCGKVFIHDAARPFVTPKLISELNAALNPPLAGVAPFTRLTDTIKIREGNLIGGTLDRDCLAAVQTPQVFYFYLLRKAYESDADATDDASLVERAGYQVGLVEGSKGNIKITHAGDLKMLEEQLATTPCTGLGYDAHKYGGDKPLKLGGVLIPGDYHVLAHSDGDTLLHALIDAILGCLGAGDIGEHFPDTDEKYRDISSAILLDNVLLLAEAQNLEITHIDLTIVAQKPRIAPYKDEIKKNVARLMGISPDSVGLKATTEEGMGFTGRIEGVKCYALVTGQKTSPLE